MQCQNYMCQVLLNNLSWTGLFNPKTCRNFIGYYVFFGRHVPWALTGTTGTMDADGTLVRSCKS